LQMIPQFLVWLFSIQESTPQTDCDWLRIIYQKMGGNVKWIPRNCCRMVGVECTDDHVTRIHWCYDYFSGSIPLEIGMLTDLKYL
jgi:hypothetical protein